MLIQTCNVLLLYLNWICIRNAVALNICSRANSIFLSIVSLPNTPRWPWEYSQPFIIIMTLRYATAHSEWLQKTLVADTCLLITPQLTGEYNTSCNYWFRAPVFIRGFFFSYLTFATNENQITYLSHCVYAPCGSPPPQTLTIV